VSLIHRREKPQRKHRADDRIAELTATYEHKLAGLREENVLLHKRLSGADDFFMIQEEYVKSLETEIRQLKDENRSEREARTAIEKDRDALERYIRDLEGQLADAERRLDVRTWAEAAAAKTQEMPAIQVMPLSQAPFATTDPARIPSWAARD
jgi:chromosome segregation ATPase